MEWLKKIFKSELIVVSFAQLLERLTKLVIIGELFVLGFTGWKMAFDWVFEYFITNVGTKAEFNEIVNGVSYAASELWTIVMFSISTILLCSIAITISKQESVLTKIHKILKKIVKIVINLIQKIGLLGVLIELLIDSSLSSQTVNGLNIIFVLSVLYFLLVRSRAQFTNSLLRKIFVNVRVQNDCIEYGELVHPNVDHYFDINKEWQPYFKIQMITTKMIKKDVMGYFKELVSQSEIECETKFKWIPGSFKFSLYVVPCLMVEEFEELQEPIIRDKRGDKK